MPDTRRMVTVISVSGNPVQMEPCHHPHCRTLVRSARRSKLCQIHAHAPGLCTCKNCTRRDRLAALEARKAAEARAANREGTRLFDPIRITFGDGYSATHTPVRLRAEPWHRDQPDTGDRHA